MATARDKLFAGAQPSAAKANQYAAPTNNNSMRLTTPSNGQPAQVGAGGDKITAVTQKVSDIQSVLKQNLEMAMDRGDKLQTMDEKSHQLMLDSEQFATKSRSVRRMMCQRNARWVTKLKSRCGSACQCYLADYNVLTCCLFMKACDSDQVLHHRWCDHSSSRGLDHMVRHQLSM